MRDEWRAEQEAAGRDAQEHWRHTRSLVDVAIGWQHRGDGIEVVLPAVRFRGTVEEVAPDLLALRTESGRVDVHLAGAAVPTVRVVAPASAGGHRTGQATGGFRAALLAREGRAVVLGTAVDPEPWRGMLAVGRDHVVVQTGDAPPAYVPVAALTYVASAEASPGRPGT